MSSFLSFFQSEHLYAFLTALIIFLITLLLAAKRWIGFLTALVLLIISLGAGFFVINRQDIRHYFSSSQANDEANAPEDFHKHFLKAMENLKTEMSTEKDNLQRVINEVQGIFDSVDLQKQKVQTFIEEFRDHFQATPEPPRQTTSESHGA